MAGIIKAAGRTDHAVGAAHVPFQFEDAGQVYLDRVRKQAANLIAEARREAAQIKWQAAEEGRQAALQAVEASLRARIDQQLHDCLAAVRSAAHAIAQSRQAWQQHWEQRSVQLAAAIAARLCRRELAAGPDIPLTWIREALALAAGSPHVTLRLNPGDHAALTEKLDAIVQSMTSLAPVRVVADSAVTPGGCRVETEFGSLDQQLEAQLARITEELL